VSELFLRSPGHGLDQKLHRAWAVGNAIGPQGEKDGPYVLRHPSNCKSPVFQDNDAPRYVKAFVAHIVVYGIQLATIIFLRIRLMRLNALKRRAQMDTSNKIDSKDLVRISQIDAVPINRPAHSGRKPLTSTCIRRFNGPREPRL